MEYWRFFVLTTGIGVTGPENKNSYRPDGHMGVLTAAYEGAALGPGAQISPCKLLSILGEGGCGMVYLAEQERAAGKQKVA